MNILSQSFRIGKLMTCFVCIPIKMRIISQTFFYLFHSLMYFPIVFSIFNLGFFKKYSSGALFFCPKQIDNDKLWSQSTQAFYYIPSSFLNWDEKSLRIKKLKWIYFAIFYGKTNVHQQYDVRILRSWIFRFYCLQKQHFRWPNGFF